MSVPRLISTLVVTATGTDGERVARLANEHAAFDPERRRVIRGKEVRAMATATASDDDVTAIVIIDRKGKVCGVLDRRKAFVEAWIEDAFLRAQ